MAQSQPPFRHQLVFKTISGSGRDWNQSAYSLYRAWTKTGLNPGPLFDTISYLENNPDVRDAGINPLSHYLQRFKGLRKSPESDMRPPLCAYRPDFGAWNRGEKRALIFSSDILPLGGLPSSGGGLRSWQIINMLKARNWDVQFSMPRDCFFIKRHWNDLTDEQKANLWTPHNQGHLAKRHRPHLIVFAHALTCHLPTDQSACVMRPTFMVLLISNRRSLAAMILKVKPRRRRQAQ